MKAIGLDFYRRSHRRLSPVATLSTYYFCLWCCYCEVVVLHAGIIVHQTRNTGENPACIAIGIGEEQAPLKVNLQVHRIGASHDELEFLCRRVGSDPARCGHTLEQIPIIIGSPVKIDRSTDRGDLDRVEI